MNKTTSFAFTSLSMNCSIDITVFLASAAGCPRADSRQHRIYVAQSFGKTHAQMLPDDQNFVGK
jgi:hypothetical protein